MNNRSLFSPRAAAARIEALRAAAPVYRWISAACGLLALLLAVPASAGDAPGWMHALVGAPLPAHDDKTVAVQLYSETSVTVQSTEKIKTVVRRAFKILRPGGRDYGDVIIFFDSQTRITSLHAWCIPAQGKDFEVKEKDGAEISLPGVPGSELVSDVRAKVLRIPAADPGNIVGYEVEHVDRPFFLQNIWYFQQSIPVSEARYSLQLPAGWEYTASWLNAREIPTTAGPNNQWTWVTKDIKALKDEDSMPPRRGIEGQMVVNFLPPAGTEGGERLSDWNAIGIWFNDLIRGRTDASAELKQKVAELTSGQPALLDKMRALARYVQRDVRYVAIELGIGGWQPHPASEVFAHQYGDCKDKVTLVRAMLQEIGVQSYYVVINTRRGSVTAAMPGHIGAFDHVIIAIHLPEGLADPSLAARLNVPHLGPLLLFDPTDDLTPFGQLSGALQASYALLVTPQGGQLIETPRLPSTFSGIGRMAHLSLDRFGALSGQVLEIRRGDDAAYQRESFRTVRVSSDEIKPVETLLSRSLSNFRITKASITNLNDIDFPIEFDYSFTAYGYAKRAGPLLLVRPRVFGSKSSALLETKDPRQEPVVFTGPERDNDTFEITLPLGYVVEDLPPPVNLDYDFASYHSKSEVKGNVLVYTRTFEIKQLIVPLVKVDELKTLYRVIASDERNDAVLKPGP
jgi:Domain of Unknown Function with PDB structure (DUF3857)/Transglutaminase-like superfamily